MASCTSNVASGGGVSSSGKVRGNIVTGAGRPSSSGMASASSAHARSSYASNGGVVADVISNVTGSVGGYFAGCNPPANSVGGYVVETATVDVSSNSSTSSGKMSPPPHGYRVYKVRPSDKTAEAKDAVRKLWGSGLNPTMRIAGSRITVLNGKAGKYVIVRMTSKAAQHLVETKPLDVIETTMRKAAMPAASSGDEASDSDTDRMSAVESDGDDENSAGESDGDEEPSIPQSQPRTFRTTVSADGPGAVAAGHIKRVGNVGGFVANIRRSTPSSSDDVLFRAGGVTVHGAGTVACGVWEDRAPPPRHVIPGRRLCYRCGDYVDRADWRNIHVDAKCKACMGK